MKKIFSKFLSIITVAAVMSFISSDSLYTFAEKITTNISDSTIVTGDLNGDGIINVFDVILERRVVISGDTSISLEIADVTGNETINTDDVKEIQDFIVGRVSGFSGTVKKAFSNVDRTMVTKTLSGEELPDAETQLTVEMAKLAESLGTYEKVFNYVLNNVNTEFYYGSRKGAIGTYEQNGGNDYDQACLLIAMLKYLGYNANFAIGEVVYTDNDLINMTSASDIEAAINIFTAQGRKLSKYETGGYLTEQALVCLKLDDNESIYYNPSFKYYNIIDETANLEDIVSKLDSQYDLTNETLNLYNVFDEINAEYGSIDTLNVFSKRQIINQEVNNTLPYNIVSEQFEYYDVLPNEKSDYVTLSLDGTIRLIGKFSHLYNKNLTIEYEFSETGAMLMKEFFGIDSIDDLTVELGAYRSYAQINAAIKLDGKPVVYGNSALLGDTEDLKIEFNTAGNTYFVEKELTYGALYSIVFDSQIISPNDIAANYSKLPQAVSEQSKISESNVYGSEYLMNTLNLIGKTYFSQVDTSNAILSEFSDVNYERNLSVAVVDFTPYIYQSVLGSPMIKKQGTIGIDVLGNQTVFKSRNNDSVEESKIGHSAGYMSSYYESEVIEQFTGMQTVSTAEVLELSAEQDIEILYLSKANIEKLDSSKLSEKNKVKITDYVNDGKYVTVPNEEITIGSWTGTGYIVYNPVTDTSAYMLNTELNGGSICSWIGFSYLCEMIATVVECTWAFDVVMLGATIFGAGLVMLTGPIGIAAIATTIAGFGTIVAGSFYIKNIGDRFYESTQLMSAYLDGDKEAGETLAANAGKHALLVGAGSVGGKLLSKPAGSLFAKTHLDQKVGSFFSKAFEKTSIGCDGALEILNRISPKYSNLLKILIKNYDRELAQTVSNAYESGEIGSIEKIVEEIDNGIAQYGDNLGKMGTYVESPNIKVDWSQYAEHGTTQMINRGITKEMVDYYVANGKALMQTNGAKYAFVTQEGVAVVTKEGKLVTTWSSKDFDEAMLWIIKKLFGE